MGNFCFDRSWHMTPHRCACQEMAGKSFIRRLIHRITIRSAEHVGDLANRFALGACFTLLTQALPFRASVLAISPSRPPLSIGAAMPAGFTDWPGLKNHHGDRPALSAHDEPVATLRCRPPPHRANVDQCALEARPQRRAGTLGGEARRLSPASLSVARGFCS